MKNKIVIHCAPCGTGTGANLGMLTVDYAIHNIISETKITHKIEVWSPWDAFGKLPKDSPILKRNSFKLNMLYGFEKHKELNNGDTVFFWGDFQWGYDYQIQTSKRLGQQNLGYDTKQLLNKTMERFMLNEVHKYNNDINIMSYGTTLFQNKISDYLDFKYKENLEWLVNRASFIRFRDPYSASLCSSIKSDYENNYLGLDAALLNTRDEIIRLSKNEFTKQYEGKIGYYFGRSTSAFPKFKVIKFLNELSEALDKKLLNLPWSYFSGGGLFLTPFDKFIKLFGKTSKLVENNTFENGDILGALSKCSIVITDTYHVAINAIALNVPVVMIPEFQPKRDRDANMGYIETWRDKRVLLYIVNDVNDFLVLPDLLSDKNYRRKKIELIKTYLNDENIRSLMYKHIHEKAMYERKTIENLLIEFSS